MCVCRRKQEEVATLESKIRQQSEQQKKAGVELDATCHICLKTKFADGVGHICHYCKIRCCARCGGKVTLRSNKVSLAISAAVSPPFALVMYVKENGGGDGHSVVSHPSIWWSWVWRWLKC